LALGQFVDNQVALIHRADDSAIHIARARVNIANSVCDVVSKCQFKHGGHRRRPNSPTCQTVSALPSAWHKRSTNRNERQPDAVVDNDDL